MSTVKATHFEHPSASTAGITLAANGSVVLPQGFTGGIGSNVVQTVKTDTFSTSSASYVDLTGLAVTITPSSASSKVLLLVKTNTSNLSIIQGFFTVNRGATELTDFIGDASGSRSPVNSAGGPFDQGAYVGTLGANTNNVMIMLLDSPATASAVTYQVRVKQAGGSTIYINRNGFDADYSAAPRTASVITAIEVAA